MVQLINYIKGYLKIKVWGISVERFMNLCGNKNILLWDIKKCDDEYEMYISLQAFYELRPIVRKTSTRVVILNRYGLPFLLPGLKKRFAFSVCCLAVIIFWFVSSLFLWNIDFEGNRKLTDEVLLDFLNKKDIRVGILKHNMDIEMLEKEIRREFTEVTWTSMKLEGTRLLISIKENDAPIIESTNKKKGENTGMDMVTHYAGKIVSMIVRSGVPKVEIGDQVEADTILVEGKIPVLNEDTTIREYLYVEADADVMLEHTIPYENTLPLFYIEKIYTGREKNGVFLRWDKKEFLLERNTPFLLYDIVTKSYQPKFFQIFSIPLYAGNIQYREYYNLEKRYTEEEAKTLLEGDLKEFLTSLEEKGVQIIEKNVKISCNNEKWVESGDILIIEKIETKQSTVIENTTDIGE